MAKVVLRNCHIEVNAVVISSHVSSVEINLSKDEVETTNFGGAGRERSAGLSDDQFVLNFQQDFDAAMVDATLFPLWLNETEFPVKVRPTAATASVGNPEYSGTCILLEYSPLSGSVGELAETEVTFFTQRDGIGRSAGTP